jgi:hypothetical protein
MSEVAPLAQGAVDEVAVARDPTHVGGAPVNVLVAQIEDVFGSDVSAQKITTCGVENALSVCPWSRKCRG